MYIVDDPTLALIVRFVIDADELDISDEEFIQRQIQTLSQYVGKYPEEQRSSRAMKWIEQHAEKYRRDWQMNVVSRQVTSKKCVDCPLTHHGSSAHCEIHSQWLVMLKRYMADEISSKRYVENALRLLQENKTHLKITARRHSEDPPQSLGPARERGMGS